MSAEFRSRRRGTTPPSLFFAWTRDDTKDPPKLRKNPAIRLILTIVALLFLLVLALTFGASSLSNSNNLRLSFLSTTTSSPTSFSFPACANYGFGPRGRADFERFSMPKQPILRDAFIRDQKLYGVINLVTYTKVFFKWSCIFSSRFFNRTVLSKYRVKQDTPFFRQTDIVECAVPELDPSIPYSISIFGSHDNTQTVQYENIPICRVASNSTQQFLGMCTTVELNPTATAPTTVEMIREWAAWHKLLGFEHAIIYVSDDVAKIAGNLEQGGLRGYFTVIDWNFAKYHSLSIDREAAQMSCLLRSRSQFTWLAFQDVDELFVSTGGLIHLLEGYSLNISGVRFCNQFFCTSTPSARVQGMENYAFKSSEPCHPILGRSIVRPANVDFFSSRVITSGQESVLVPESQGFLAHLHSEALCKNATSDLTVVEKWGQVKSILEG